MQATYSTPHDDTRGHTSCNSQPRHSQKRRSNAKCNFVILPTQLLTDEQNKRMARLCELSPFIRTSHILTTQRETSREKEHRRTEKHKEAQGSTSTSAKHHKTPTMRLILSLFVPSTTTDRCHCRQRSTCSTATPCFHIAVTTHHKRSAWATM